MGRRATTLRVAFLAGAITDALALIPLLLPSAATEVWGIDAFSPATRFASTAAALMLGWTLLLVWAYRRPTERRGVAGLTIVVILGLVASEIAAVLTGATTVSRLAATWVLQLALVVLFLVGLRQSRESAEVSI